MTNSGNAFAIATQIQVLVGGPATTYLVEWNAVVSDGATQSFSITGCFNFDSTQSIAANACAFKASVAAAAAADVGLTIPVANILVVMGVY